jgi:hypothetical protein
MLGRYHHLECTASNGRMTDEYELGRIWKEAVVA